ncbi:MAG: TIGR03546 family protein [Nitrospirota bacterium]|nr:TIGR03546 family protein [Nitrospirota bacterium]MDE3224404.1 TIGR03546 family protein [Nitrospirota bacterium]MDE3244134.1 TIGR03546 family protein [Nitrospirota bacterium]
MMRMLARLLAVLNSETHPGQISLGFCFAMVAGFTPLMSLHNLLVLLLVLVIRVNLSAFLLGLPVWSGLAFGLDPLFHRVGLAVLTNGSLASLWTSLYNSTLWRLEHFNNSIVMGSLLVSLLAFAPLYVLSNLAIRRYRAHVLAWVEKTRVMQLLKASRFYSLYQSFSGMGGGL